MKKIPILFLLSVTMSAIGQQRVTFIIDSMPTGTKGSIFLAGNFNMWNPADSSYQFSHSDSGNVLVLTLPSGVSEFKVTRGNWATVEENADFKPMSNRSLHIQSDTTVHLVVGVWADARPAPNKMATNTASPQVHIVDTAFYMPQLKRSRRIWIYLPADYQTSRKKYPVIYMHDGQNVFDAATSYSGEWGVDEFLDSLQAGCKEVIVVAVDNGSDKRMQEYNPWEFMKFGKGEGDLYVDFLVRTLKPYIDKRYRTFPNKKNTSVAGSSMGGLISLYAVIKYPNVFGSAGVFSPAFWTAGGIDSAVVAGISRVDSKLFFYAGGKEGETMLPDMYRIGQEIRTHSISPVKEIVDTDARHNEAAWRKHFPEFFHWVFCDGS